MQGSMTPLFRLFWFRFGDTSCLHTISRLEIWISKSSPTQMISTF